MFQKIETMNRLIPTLYPVNQTGLQIQLTELKNRLHFWFKILKSTVNQTDGQTSMKTLRSLHLEWMQHEMDSTCTIAKYL